MKSLTCKSSYRRTITGHRLPWGIALSALLSISAGGWAAQKTEQPWEMWLPSLEEGTEQANRLRKPIFVSAGAAWCGWCRRLDQELGKPEVRVELARWMLVRLDVDKSPGDARKLGIGPVPALRVLTSNGRIIATRDGYLPAGKLLTWLKQQYDAALVLPAEGLTDDQPPDAERLQLLIRTLRHRDATLREAATRRLLAHPRIVSAAVVEAFADGNLATRLAVLELLREWRAPIDALDPWQPETITAASLEALEQWAGEYAEPVGPTAGNETSDAQYLGILTELDALPQTDSDAAANAIRERLARAGRDLLPEVYERLKHAATDRERERLTALRYRLVATDQLVLDWPGGLERLAATDAQTRHRAAAELAKRAKSTDSPLLLELFSDPDPLVREISLRALRDVGGAEAAETLAGLLNDPEPNVRAAVLKELAESPSTRLVAKLTEYVATESDPDLIVHAVRAFRDARNEDALDALVKLLDHSSWRVRAESAEALGKLLSSWYDLAIERKAGAYLALIRRLDDEDGFVVSRAVKGLQSVNLIAAVEPLVRAAVRHPEIAPEALRVFRRKELRKKATPALRELCHHDNAQVRAAAISAISSSGFDELVGELPTALADPDEEVRLAAAKALYSALGRQRPSNWTAGAIVDAESFEQLSSLGYFSGGAGRNSTSAGKDSEEWLAEFHSGTQRPEWMTGAIEPLRRMLTADSAEMRLAGALPLIALGEDEAALPVVVSVIETEPDLLSTAASALAWLSNAPRVQLFALYRTQELNEQQLRALVQAPASLPDDTSSDLLWSLVADEDATEEVAAAVERSLRSLYLGTRYNNPARISSAAKKRALAAARPHATDGPELQRLVALLVLAMADKDVTAEVAEALAKDDEISPALRRDAFQILLLSQAPAERRRTALTALSGDNADQRKLALRCLAMGADELRALRDERFHVGFSVAPMSAFSRTRGQKIKPEAPAGMQADAMRSLLGDSDPEVAAQAAYFLSLMGDRGGLEPLLEYWRRNHQDNEQWRRLVYRAVTALNDDELTPILEEIYGGYDHQDYSIGEFYWTIRTVKGPQILKLRKRIRGDVGMDFLR